MPAEHAIHVAAAVWLVALEYVPVGHGTGAAPPPGQYMPAGHTAVFVVAPPAQLMPALHGRQLAELAEFAYEPAGHGEQAELPAAAKVPAAQARHDDGAAAPATAEAVPAGHGCDAAAAGQNHPAGQTTEFCVAPGGHIAPAWHAMQAPAEVAPGCAEKYPAAHCAGGEPEPEQYCPAGHTRLLAVEPAGQ